MVAEGDLVEALDLRPEAFEVFRLAARRDGGERAAVEGALEGDDAEPLRVAARRGQFPAEAQARDALGLRRAGMNLTPQRMAMWVLWTRFESRRVYTEREVNALLKAWTVYGDHVTPRRELVNMGLLAREDDCSAYWKQAQRPSDEVQALLQAVRERSRRGRRVMR